VASRRLTYIIVGAVLLFFGSVFALQGANVITGSSVMSGNSTYIYVGGVLAAIGLVLLLVGVMSRSKREPSSAPSTPAPSTGVSSAL